MTAPYPFTIGGQSTWFHDEGSPAGIFHTYDAMQVGGPGDAPRKVHVFLPRDYEKGGPYPVVYMNDGDTAFWGGGAGGKSWNVAGGLSELYAQDAIPRVIVVAICPLFREREYAHTEGRPGGPGGGIDEYTTYVADLMKGFIDANYKTAPGASSAAIIGSSHGGLAAFLMATRRPDCFGYAGCLSPSFWVGLDGIHGGSYGGGFLRDSLLIQRAKDALSRPGTRPRIWIDWGLVRAGGRHNAVIEAAATARGKEMAELLEQSFGYTRGVELFTEEDPDGEHDEGSWARRFPRVMRAFLNAK